MVILNLKRVIEVTANLAIPGEVNWKLIFTNFLTYEVESLLKQK